MRNQRIGFGYGQRQLGLFYTPQVNTGLQTYRGKVVDFNTNKPMSAANVYYYKNGKLTGTITNQNGEYVIQANPNDVVIISFMGFETIKTLAAELENIEYMQTNIEELDTAYITNKKEGPKNNRILFLGLGVLAIVIGSSFVNSDNSKPE
jgi:hypothetical protein